MARKTAEKVEQKETEFEYVVVSEISRELLQERVISYIANGYIPIGGVAIDKVKVPFEDEKTLFYQAVVKLEIVQIA